jgi:hypothetical protein
MSNVVEQLTPNPVNHEHGENGCCQNALEAKWKLESQRKVKPKTNGDKIRAMTDEELAENLPYLCDCPKERYDTVCANFRSCFECWLSWLKAPVACEESQKQDFPLAEKKGNAK